MNLVHVIPIARGIAKDQLTYFSAKEIKPGAMVSISVRRKQIPGLVVSVENAAHARGALRDADHRLKKISAVKCKHLIAPQFLAAAERLAEYSAASLGAILSNILPAALLRESERFEAKAPLPPQNDSPFKSEIQVLQDTDDQRLSFYKSLIREEFAKNNSVLLCLPTMMDVDEFLVSLGKGIHEYTFTLHGQMTKRGIIAVWNEALALAHPILLVITPSFMSLPRPDFKTIIIDRETSSAYKTLSRPFADFRRLAEYLAAEYGARLILGDIYARTETLHRIENHEILPLNSLKQRIISTAKSAIFTAQSGEALTAESQELIRRSTTHHERLFILANRRGLSPLVVCDDCGNPVTCERCQAPIILHQSPTKEVDHSTVFVCHRCNHRQSARVKCTNCQSWRLRALGTGIEKIVAEVTALFPETTVFQLDSDSVKTSKAAQKIAVDFVASPGSILVGTEMALRYLREKVENGLVVATDSLLCLPDFRLHEKLFGLLIKTRGIAARRFAIQTRHPEEPLFEHLLAGNLIGFYRQEVADRRTFDYPPFKTLIKISIEGEKAITREEMKKAAELLEEYEPAVYPSFHAIRRGKYRLNLLLKVAAGKWPSFELAAKLRSLPPYFAINVDPQDIL